MYIEDERFTSYYYKGQSGTEKLFKDAIRIYTGIK